MPLLPLTGPTYDLLSRPASVQRTVNLIPVPLEPGNERTGWVLKDVPGLTVFDVCVPPSFTLGAEESGDVPLTVQFTLTEVSGSGPFTFLWDFGDDTNSTEQNPEHEFADGTYDVTVTITNACGSQELSAASAGFAPLLLYNFEQPNGSFAFIDDVGHSMSDGSSGLGGATRVDTTQAKFGSGSLRLREGTELQLGRSSTISGFNTEFDLGGVSFTYEFWLYVETGTTYVDCGWWGNISAFGQRTWRVLWLLQGGEPGLEVELFDNNFILDAAVAELQYSTWQHIALCYDHDTTTARVFVDGVLVATGDLSAATYTDTYEPSLILWGTDGVAYIDCLRVVKDVAVYTEAFTAPATVLIAPTDPQADASEVAGILVRLKGLGNASGGDVVDDTGKIVTLETTDGHLGFSAGDNALSNSDGCIQMQRLSGQSIMGAHFEIQPGPDMNLGGGDWTCEFFYKRNASTFGSIRFPGCTGATTPSFVFLQFSDTVNVTVNNGISTVTLFSDTEVIDQWNHVALVRDGSTLSLYVNGDRIDTDTIGFDIPERPINWPCVTGELFSQGTGNYIRVDGIRVSDSAIYSGATLTIPTSY
jgi:hypothetical protein